MLKERTKITLPVLDVNKIPWKYELKRNRLPLDSAHRTVQVQLDTFWYHADKGFTGGCGKSKARGRLRKNLTKEAQSVVGSPFGPITEIITLTELQEMLNEAIRDACPDLKDDWNLKETRWTPLATLVEEIIG